MGIGDWGLGIGDWGLGIGDWANPQSPIPILKEIKTFIKKELLITSINYFYFNIILST